MLVSQHVHIQSFGAGSPKRDAAITDGSNYTCMSCCDMSKCPVFFKGVQRWVSRWFGGGDTG